MILLATVNEDLCHKKFPCLAVDILINCNPDLSITTILTFFDQKNTTDTNLSLRQQSLSYFLLKTHPQHSLTNLTDEPQFTKYFPLNSHERLKLFLSLTPLSQEDTYETQLKFLGISDDKEFEESDCI